MIEFIIIGASAGGDKALTKIIPRLNNELKIPLLIVLHNLTSAYFVEILSRKTTIPISLAESGLELNKGNLRIYVAKSGFHTRIIKDLDNRRVIFAYEEKSTPFIFPNISETMLTASTIFAGKLMGVILTGMGSDGVEGMRAIKKNGGITIVQDPALAEFSSMPKSVTESGIADYILPLGMIPSKINQLAL
ncbi:MAG TPA: chemotaxis protein CheB [Ignavibacteriaceae bacterium]|nr:chemotaxis protein CheB [Ignavibacteriaceae bacterium]